MRAGRGAASSAAAPERKAEAAPAEPFGVVELKAEVKASCSGQIVPAKQQELAKVLQCKACGKVCLGSPVKTPCCLQLFHRDCLSDKLEAERKCPACGGVIPSESDAFLQPDPAVLELAGIVQVDCPQGCGDSVHFKELTTHVGPGGGCLLTPVRCQNKDCKEVVARREAQQHHEDCEHRHQPCPMCDLMVKQKNMPRHVGSKCPKRPADCKHCKKLVPHLSNMGRHIRSDCTAPTPICLHTQTQESHAKASKRANRQTVRLRQQMARQDEDAKGQLAELRDLIGAQRTAIQLLQETADKQQREMALHKQQSDERLEKQCRALQQQLDTQKSDIAALKKVDTDQQALIGKRDREVQQLQGDFRELLEREKKRAADAEETEKGLKKLRDSLSQRTSLCNDLQMRIKRQEHGFKQQTERDQAERERLGEELRRQLQLEDDNRVDTRARMRQLMQAVLSYTEGVPQCIEVKSKEMDRVNGKYNLMPPQEKHNGHRIWRSAKGYMFKNGDSFWMVASSREQMTAVPSMGQLSSSAPSAEASPAAVRVWRYASGGKFDWSPAPGTSIEAVTGS
eukprot:TRINITY_DN518_c0_g1_i16.p1 TRINITY_DN518_c0_g1~~TRINITY_DN518_c0_g1_i16.p1  ORF type:complete len:603 (+),score=170.39 TRINITY_DN518_c0_g1_i16:108-1811(+)